MKRNKWFVAFSRSFVYYIAYRFLACQLPIIVEDSEAKSERPLHSCLLEGSVEGYQPPRRRRSARSDEYCLYVVGLPIIVTDTGIVRDEDVLDVMGSVATIIHCESCCP